MDGLTRESLRPLLDLQRVDSGIDRLTQRRADLPEQRELHELEGRRAELVATNDERSRAFDEVSKQQARLEDEVTMLADKINREQGRLYGGEISNPKELASIQAELDALRRRKNHVEDQLLDVLEQREAMEAEISALAAQLDDFDRQIAATAQRRDAAAVEIETELRALAAQRESLRPHFPDDVLELYDELRARKEGVGAAALEGGVCRGCNVRLSPMALDEIKHSGDPVPRCEYCRRIVVVL